MDKPRDIEFGKRMKAARERKGITQKQLAQEFDMSERSIQFYEQGRSKPPARKLAEIAKFLGVTADDLLREDSDLGGYSDDKPRSQNTNQNDTPPEELAFFEWVQEHVTGMHFYDFKKAMENQEWLKGLRVIYEKEKDRKPGQKQGE